MQTRRLGKIYGLDISVSPSALVWLAALWGILAVVGVALLHLSLVEAVVGALLATLLHVVGEILHQIGHARAARQTGYPMTGVRLWGVFGMSIYPPDEPALPAAVHIRRALGGPTFSLLVSVVALVILIVMSLFSKGLPFWLSLFFFLDNLFTFTLGSFLPLGFTDGSTIFYWRSHR
jgi:hypothetical protein